MKPWWRPVINCRQTLIHKFTGAENNIRFMFVLDVFLYLCSYFFVVWHLCCYSQGFVRGANISYSCESWLQDRCVFTLWRKYFISLVVGLRWCVLLNTPVAFFWWYTSDTRFLSLVLWSCDWLLNFAYEKLHEVKCNTFCIQCGIWSETIILWIQLLIVCCLLYIRYHRNTKCGDQCLDEEDGGNRSSEPIASSNSTLLVPGVALIGITKSYVCWWLWFWAEK